MRWLVLMMLVSNAALAGSLESIDVNALASMSRSDANFVTVRDAWANLQQDQANEQRIVKMQRQLDDLQRRLQAIDDFRANAQQQIAGGVVKFTAEEIAARKMNASSEITRIQAELKHMQQLQNWYTTGDSTLAGLSVDQLEGSPPPDVVNREIADLTVKLADAQKQLANPERALPVESAQIMQSISTAAARLEQDRKPILAAIAMLRGAIDTSNSQPALGSPSDREWLLAHQSVISPLMK